MTNASRHFRRGAVRLLYREGRRLGLVHSDPTRDVVLPPRSVLSTRPLTDDEMELCRLGAMASLTDLRLPTVWALAECTARIAEIPKVRIRDLDFAAGTVFLMGSTRTDPRHAPMTDWAAAQLRRRLEDRSLASEPDAVLVPWRTRNVKRPGNAATMAVIEVLRNAGVHGEPDVRPASVPAWAGASLLGAGHSIVEVALALGCRSLDQAARMIDYDWRCEA